MASKLRNVGRRPRRGGFLVSRRTHLAFATLAAALVVSGASFALGNTGTYSTNIQPAAGSPAGGEAASVDTSIVSSVTRSEGNAQLQTGVTLARIEVAAVYAAKLQVSIFWTDPYDANAVLNNPNAQISVGIYHPIHTGTCVNKAKSTVAQYVTVTDGTGNTYCSKLDESATGSASVSSSDKLLLTRTIPGGYLMPTVADSGSLLACTSFTGTASAEASLSWCEPTGTASGTLASSGPGVLYVVSSILTPKGIPQGQQSNLNSLSFFVNAVTS